MASYAFAANQYRLARLFVKFDGLMAAVHARYIASAASVAKVIIEYCIDNSIDEAAPI